MTPRISNAESQAGGIKRLWDWANGKKTLIAAILLAVPVIWEGVAQILQAAGMGAAQIAAIGGIVLGIVGVIHKLLKAVGIATKPPKDQYVTPPR